MRPTEAAATEWMTIGEAVGLEYAAASRYQRREVLERASVVYGRKPQTIRRIVKAAEYVRERMKEAGLRRDQLAAPVVSVEALARIEALEPATASSLMSPVLMGKVPFRKLLARENELRRKHETMTRQPGAWTAFASATQALIGPGDKEWTFQADRTAYTAAARFYRVDWEVRGRSIEPTAVFLAPYIIFSCSRDAADSQMVHMLAATMHFTRVLYLCMDTWEEERVRSFVQDICRNHDPQLETASIEEIPYVRENASMLIVPDMGATDVD